MIRGKTSTHLTTKKRGTELDLLISAGSKESIGLGELREKDHPQRFASDGGIREKGEKGETDKICQGARDSKKKQRGL